LKILCSLPADDGDCEEATAQHHEAGVDVDALAAQLQEEGAQAFAKSWRGLLAQIEAKRAALKSVG
jgi:transaldolase